ncbi:MAG: protein translocase subunit SecF [Candidatus Levybacteria bacterium]|nr:protein translocase subunit SecF [Candidatus Levybacteria bacterium]
MLDIIGKKNIYFLISLIVIIPGLVSLFIFGLRLSIEFTGGSRLTLVYPKTVDQKLVQDIRSTFEEAMVEVSSISPAKTSVIVRTAPMTQKQDIQITDALREKTGQFTQADFDTVGPVIGQETTNKAVLAVLFASILIVIYIAMSFRKVPRPASSWRFGVCAILAVLHDALVLIGIFSLLGHFLHVEVDSLFITAVLTVIGFSVHDTIVVFDRIRENLLKTSGIPFPQLVNNSILQTITRSLNTSLTAIIVLVTLLIFGGESVRWFVVALLIGIISGTYSSIFNAAPLLVTWQEWDLKRKKSITSK